MAGTVLQPLVRCIDSAHTEVMESAARVGWTGVQLVPLVEAQAGAASRGGSPLGLGTSAPGSCTNATPLPNVQASRGRLMMRWWLRR